MAKGLSPTQRTLRALREQGRVVDTVERRIAIPGSFGITKDYLGILDLIALDPVNGIVGVQSTGSDHAGHYRKLTVEMAENTLAWLEAGGKLELWSWRKVKVKRGGLAVRWAPRVQVITVQDVIRANREQAS